MISLCILAKNEEHCIQQAINSVKTQVSEIILVDDASTDNTVQLAQECGARICELPFSVADQGFGDAASWMIRQAEKEWILILDADEVIIEATSRLHPLTQYKSNNVWGCNREVASIITSSASRISIHSF